MAINTIGSIQDVLKNHKTKNWTQPSSLEGVGNLDWAKDIAMPSGGSSDVKSFLASSIGSVNNLQQEANVAIQKLASGENKNLHETMLTVERAEIAFKQMNQVRQKVIDAYKEVMRMQI
jgi:flagellar hook-basal body complex protein FliE